MSLAAVMDSKTVKETEVVVVMNTAIRVAFQTYNCPVANDERG